MLVTLWSPKLYRRALYLLLHETLSPPAESQQKVLIQNFRVFSSHTHFASLLSDIYLYYGKKNKQREDKDKKNIK